MTALTKDKPREYELGHVNEFGVAATTTIYEGAAVGDNGSGYARPLVAGDKFLGFCERPVSNLAPVNNIPGPPSGGAGDKNVRVNNSGLIQLPVTGVIATSVGAPVYASDEDTFTLTGAGNSPIGKVYRVIASDIAIVAFGDRVCDAHLASHVAVFGGAHTTTGGAAAENFTVTGVLSTDIVVAEVATQGGTPRTLNAVTAAANSIHLTFSGDPSTDHVVNYLVFRAA
jgi:hypothetical protein